MLTSPADAFIARLYSLKEVMKASGVIAEGKIESVNTGRGTAVARIDRNIKGKTTFKQFKMNVGVGQSYFPQVLMKRLKAGAPVVFFYTRKNGSLACLGHSDGIWFQLFGDARAQPEKMWWRFTHIEIHMNRTYAGSTPELIALVQDVVDGKREAPPANPRLPALTRKDLLDGTTTQVASAEPEPEPPEEASRPPERPAPEPESEAIDGIEASDDWQVEDWGNPGHVRAVESLSGRGKLLVLRYGAGEKDKTAASRMLKTDLSAASRLGFEAFNAGSRPVKVAWAFSTLPEWEYFESPPITLWPGQWGYGLGISLADRSFKSAATEWEHRAGIRSRDQIGKVTLLIYDAEAKGSLVLDRVLPDARRLFVRSIPLPSSGGECHGLSWADYDYDGDLDALICCAKGNRLYRNDRGEFVDVTDASGLHGGSRCASWADFDRDGDPDLLFSTPTLWRNNAGRFEDASRLLPRLAARNTEGAGWLDADGDGNADILLTNGQHGINLFLNQGEAGEGFRDVSDEWGLGRTGIGVGNGDFLAVADYDADGFADFLYNLGKGVIAHNEEGERFAPASGPGVEFRTSNDHKIGVTLGDYDTDGDFDLFVPQDGRSRLFRNNNDFTFTDVTEESGDLADVPGKARAAAWGDVNGDGALDLVVSFAGRPARLYISDGKGNFTDQTDGAGLLRFACANAATGLAFADFDGDGDEDLLLNSEGGNSGILVNGSPRANGSMATVRVQLPASEPPGAVIRLLDRDENTAGIRQVGLVQNFSAQGPPGASWRVKPGNYDVSILFTDGEVLQQTVKAERGVTICDIAPRDDLEGPAD